MTGHGEGAQVVRFALSGKALPMTFDTLRWGELARQCAMSQYGRSNRGAASRALSGKDASGIPLTGHGHAFYLPTDEDGDGRLDHLTVWAPGGLTAGEFQSVASVNTLNPGGQREPVQLAYLAHGAASDFAGVSPLFSVSKSWRSLTPYVLPRHVKFRGPRDESGRKPMVDGPEEQISREVSLRYPGGSSLVSVEVGESPNACPAHERGPVKRFSPLRFFQIQAGWRLQWRRGV